ncbi:MAG: sigma-70 family RNA polymerase sigma factor [Deltaproteobacteria bacterium]|nr:sigma-70 family RNA polymerase sigma factor [Deltaproteobacteria bacterium]
MTSGSPNIETIQADSEVALAMRVAAGDDVAAHQFLQLALPRVRKTALFLCPDRMEQEDVVQNTLVELILAAGTFRGDSRFSWWVDRITVHMASRIIGKKVRRRRIHDDAWFPPAMSTTPDDELDYRRMQHELATVLEKISLRDRTPLILHHLYGYAIDEIALMLDVGVHTVRSRLRTGMKKMKRLVLSNGQLADWIQVTS